MAQPILPIDYSSKDYQSFLADMKASIPNFLAEWTDRSPGDMGIVLLELFSYMGDILSYYGDRIANEAYLATAVQRSSVLKIAAMLDYRPTDNTAAVTTLDITIKAGTVVTLPSRSQFSTKASSLDAAVIFETTSAHSLDALAPTTTIASGSNGAVLPQATIDVVDTTGYPTAGQFTIDIAGPTTITYTGLTSNTFTGCTGGAGTMATGQAVVGVQAGTVPFTGIEVAQGFTVANEALGNSQGTADQVFTLFQSPVIEGSVQVFVDEGDFPRLWTFFDHLTDAEPTDPAYTTFTDDNNIVNVVFGDGVNGRIPNPQAIISATYRVGGGIDSNVGTNSITEILSIQPNIVSVNNPSPAVGGSEAESVDHIRTQAPKSLAAVNRAVTLGDYAALALKVPGIVKAKATAEVFTNISLYIHPAGGFLPSSQLETVVAAYAPLLTNPPPGGINDGYLDDKKMIGASVTVLPPQYASATGYVPIYITIGLAIIPQYSFTAVQQNLVFAVNELLSFDNVGFGSRITQSSIYHTVQKLEGVDFMTLTELRRGDQTPGSVQDIFLAASEMPTLQSVSVTNITTSGLP